VALVEAPRTVVPLEDPETEAVPSDGPGARVSSGACRSGRYGIAADRAVRNTSATASASSGRAIRTAWKRFATPASLGR
jgi:hypothetical protein